MAVGALAEAAVQVVADTSKFEKDFGDDVKKSTDKATEAIEDLGKTTEATGEKVDQTAKKLKGLADTSLQTREAALKLRQADLALTEARAHLAKVTQDQTATEEQRAKALLAVDAAVLRKAKAERDAVKITEEATRATEENASSSDRASSRLQKLAEASLLGRAGVSGLTIAALALGPALLPVLAAAVVGVAGLGASMAAAGVAGGVFGAVLIGNFTKMTEAIEAARAGTGQLTGPLGQAARAYMAMGDAWDAFLKKNEPATFGLIAAGFGTLTAIIPKLQPLLDAATGAAQRFFARLQTSVSGGGLDEFIGRLAQHAGPALDSLGIIAGNTGRALASMLLTFLPHGQSLLSWLEGVTARWAAWSAQLGDSSGFGQFIAFARANLPAMIGFFDQFVAAVTNLVVALAPAAPAALGLLRGIAIVVAAMPPDLLGTLIAGLVGVAAAVKVWAVAQAALNLAMSLNPIGAVIVAVVALAFIIIRNWTTIKAATVTAWNAVWGAIVTAWEAIKSAVQAGIDFLVNLFLNFTLIGLIIQHWDAIKAAISAAIGFIVGIVQVGLGVLQAIWSAVWSVFGPVVMAVWGLIKAVVGLAIAIVVGVVRSHLLALQVIWTTVWNAIVAVASAVWARIRVVVIPAVNAIRTAVTVAVNAIRAVVTAVFNAVRAVVTSVWNSVRSVTVAAWNSIKGAVSSGASTVVSTVSGLARRVLGAVAGFGRLLFNAGRDLIRGLLDGITSMIGKLTGKINEVTDKVGRFFPGSPVKEGPLVSWNHGAVGERLAQQLIDGLRDQERQVVAAAERIAMAAAAGASGITLPGPRTGLTPGVGQGFRGFGPPPPAAAQGARTMNQTNNFNLATPPDPQATAEMVATRIFQGVRV